MSHFEPYKTNFKKWNARLEEYEIQSGTVYRLLHTEESAANIRKLTAILISTDNHETSGMNAQTYKKM